MFAHGEVWTLKELFVYPNEFIYWSIQIVMYPFMTGLVAGAFVLSSLYHVFGIKQLKDMARFALVFSFALLFVAPMPLMFHLLQPFRGINVFMTPHFTSAIAAFGIVFFAYGAIVASELWFIYRKHFAEIALPLKEKKDKSLVDWFKYLVFCALTLGVYDISEESLKRDEKAIKILAGLGIPVACFLHGYAGFIFGSVKANALWMTPLMPVIFIMSAIVSGIALCMLTYIIAMEIRKFLASRKKTAYTYPQTREEIGGVEINVIRMTTKYLLLFLVFAISLELLDLIFRGYTAVKSWEILRSVIYEKKLISLFFLQYGIGSLVPFILLLIPGLTIRRAVVGVILVLFGVFMMRWNVVIGGQAFSLTFAGFMHYHLPIIPHNWETFKEGPGGALLIFFMPFFLFWIFAKIFPVFPKRKGITANDIMTHMPLTVTTETSVKEVAGILASKNISGVPVIDSNKKVIGVVSESDIIFRKGAGESVTAKDIMTAPPVTAHADTSLQDLSQIMADKGVKRVIITDKEGHATGVVSRIDVVRAQEMGE